MSWSVQMHKIDAGLKAQWGNVTVDTEEDVNMSGFNMQIYTTCSKAKTLMHEADHRFE